MSAVVSARPNPASQSCVFILDAAKVPDAQYLDADTLRDIRSGLDAARFNYMRHDVTVTEIARDEGTVTIRVNPAV